MFSPLPASDRSADLELARKCAAGDRAAQQQLFRAQRGAVHATLFRVLGSNRQIEDLIQDTFIAVFESIHAFRGDSSLRTWIDTIAVRVCYRHLSRREPRSQLHAVGELIASASDPEREANLREAVRRLYIVLDRVEPKQRVAYTLHVVDGRPLKEVARVTRVSVLAVKNRVWRARRRVRELAERDPLLIEFLSARGDA
jgi:RNA polymerase sigma-70 factor, ECF subfamily